MRGVGRYWVVYGGSNPGIQLDGVEVMRLMQAEGGSTCVRFPNKIAAEEHWEQRTKSGDPVRIEIMNEKVKEKTVIRIVQAAGARAADSTRQRLETRGHSE